MQNMDLFQVFQDNFSRWTPCSLLLSNQQFISQGQCQASFFTTPENKEMLYSLSGNTLKRIRTQDAHKSIQYLDLSWVVITSSIGSQNSLFPFQFEFRSKNQQFSIFTDNKAEFSYWKSLLKLISVFREVCNDYIILRQIGRGSFSIVSEVKDKSSGQILALKSIEKHSFLSSKQLFISLKNEISLLRKFHHQNLIKLLAVYQSSSSIDLIMNLAVEGSLFNKITTRGTYSQYEMKNVLRQLLDVIKYLHQNGVVHRDIKPQNVLFGPNQQVYLADLGLSVYLQQEKIQCRCGTEGYIAPEMKNTSKKYDLKIDIYGIGILSYIMIQGFFPNSKKKCFKTHVWQGVSKICRRFIKVLIHRDPCRRPNAVQALENEWVSSDNLQSIAAIRRKSRTNPCFSEFRTLQAKPHPLSSDQVSPQSSPDNIPFFSSSSREERFQKLEPVVLSEEFL